MISHRVATVARRLLSDRRRSLLWWSVAFVSFIEINVVFYPSVKGQDDFNQMMEEIPESLRVLTGITEDMSITSPVGYLQSQLFALFFPLLLLIFGVGLGANVLAGAEQAGTLEFLLTQPVSRREVAVARVGALMILMIVLTLVGTLSLVVTNPLVGLDAGIPYVNLVAACVEGLLLALVFAALAFAVGAASGRKAEAIAAASAAAAVAFLLNGFGDLIDLLGTLRVASPWHWYVGSDPLTNGFTLFSTVPPLATTAVLVAFGVWAFERRDLH